MTDVTDATTPRQQGYRMPAEWEEQTAVWFQWPEKVSDPSIENRLHFEMTMEKTWLLMAWEIHKRLKVNILVHSEQHREHIRSNMQYFAFNMAQVEFHITSMLDVWHRDSGPIFVTNGKGELAVTDWNFNGWGSYPEHGIAEKHIPETVAKIVDVPVFTAPIVTEGGAVEVNGTGSFMATRSSIINDNRNPGMSQADIEAALGDYLGVRNFIWLSGAPADVCVNDLGDGTDYHIDIAARFVGKSTVLYAWTEDQSDPRYPYLVKHLEELESATDEDGEALTLLPMYLPESGVYVIGKRLEQGMSVSSDFTDASYLNYLVTNGLVLVPAFGNVNDIKAQKVLANLFPERDIIPVPVVSLTAEGGAIHCVTQHQPAAFKS